MGLSPRAFSFKYSVVHPIYFILTYKPFSPLLDTERARCKSHFHNKTLCVLLFATVHLIGIELKARIPGNSNMLLYDLAFQYPQCSTHCIMLCTLSGNVTEIVIA